jgi:hypothetical protein
MAALPDLEDALVNAHKAGDTKAASALANEIYRMKQTAPKTGGVGGSQGAPGPALGEIEAGVIGAGRTLDKIAEGNRQLGLNAMVAGKQAMGMDSRPQLDALRKQEEVQSGNDAVYKQLQAQHPFATRFGEAGPFAATPLGGASAFARVAIPAVTYGLGGVAEYGSPQERAIKGAGQAAAGLTGGIAGEVSSLLINPVRNAMSTPAQEAAKSAAQKIGAPLLPSQQSGSSALATIEDMLARAPGSSGVMRDFMQKGKDAVAAKAQGSINESAPLTKDILGGAKDRMGKGYEDMRSQISGMPANSDVFDAITKAEKMLTAGSRNGKESQLSMLSELKDKLYNTKQLTPEEYQGWVTDLGSTARESKNMTVAAALRLVGKEMDKAARGPLAKEWGDLDKQYGNLKMLMKPGVTNEMTGEVNPRMLSIRMDQQMKEAGKTGKVHGPLVDIADYGKAVPRLREGSQTFEREAASNPLQWLLAAPRYAAAKGMTSEAMREYLSKGLMASPEASRRVAELAQLGLLPGGVAGINLGLMGLLDQ